METPSTGPQACALVLDRLALDLSALQYRAVRHPGTRTAGLLYARPHVRDHGAPYQLVVGHADTVWPMGTLATMPIRSVDGTLAGPGVFDMKAGLTQLVFALKALRALRIEPTVTPVVVVNADEEIGSPDSARHISRLAAAAHRALVLEPALGAEGRLKTQRKGIGRFTLVIRGRAAHAGLDPEAGASAILELSHQVRALFDLNDPARGVTVNVGMVDGGLRPNVVAPTARAVADVRVRTQLDAEEIDARIRALRPHTPGTHVEVSGGFGRPPMEASPRGAALFLLAQQLGSSIGLRLSEASVGGGSDANLTAQHTPTLDGLGPVGASAHAHDEHIQLDSLPERASLLTLLLAAPAQETSDG